MKASVKVTDLIRKSEGFKPKPYLCPAGVPTIGYGTTRYPNGVKVNLRDPEISEQKATELLLHDLTAFENDVNFLTSTVRLTQKQFDALVDFAYNVGSDIDIDSTPEGLGDSTLLKKVLNNPEDFTIKDEFRKWIHGNGKILPGLITRREAEITLYFS